MNPEHDKPQRAELVTITVTRSEFELIIGTLAERCQEIEQGNDFDQIGEAHAIGRVEAKLEEQAQPIQQQPASPQEQRASRSPGRRWARCSRGFTTWVCSTRWTWRS